MKKINLCSGILVFTMLAGVFLPTIVSAEELKCEWREENGNLYWYENGIKQGVKYNENGTIDESYRGKEIYDPGTKAWYWLDAVDGGKKAVSKDVYQESESGIWGDETDSAGVTVGKWVRYDADGRMIKGWNTNDNGTYYFDLIYGTMAKGYATIEGKEYYFNAGSGVKEQELGEVPEFGWKEIDGNFFWYEGGIRQGYSVKEGYRGKEIFDPESNAWYWLDNVDGGKKATNKDVYQESQADDKGNIGKWVHYDENGYMVKGWSDSEKGRYYFDPIYGTMAKGIVTIEGKYYKFDENTGILIGEVSSEELEEDKEPSQDENTNFKVLLTDECDEEKDVLAEVGDVIILVGKADGGEAPYQYRFWIRNVQTDERFLIRDYEGGQMIQYKMEESGVYEFYAEVKDASGVENHSSAKKVTVGQYLEYEGYLYKENDDGETITIIGYEGNEEIISVPSKIDGKTVISINNCFNYNDTVKEITLPDTLSDIGFVGTYCSNLQKVVINAYKPKPQGVVTFRVLDGLFGNCPKLDTVIVVENDVMKTLYAKDNILYYYYENDGIDGVFLYPGGKKDTEYVFTEEVRLLSAAFENNDYIEKIVFEKGVKEVLIPGAITRGVSCAFRYCDNLKTVQIEGITHIGGSWFEQSVSFKEFTIPNTVTMIEAAAFNDCLALESIVLPESVAYIENSAFQGCTALKDCWIYNDNLEFEDDSSEYIWNNCDKSKLVLHGHAGSTIQAYAEKFDIQFEVIP